MRSSIIVAAALASLGIAASSFADTTELARSGAWKAFGGTTDSGRPVCGMSSSGTGKYFSVKYYRGDDTLTIQLGNDKWTLKDKVKVKTAMKIDKASPWNATATGMHFGDGDAGLEFEISKKQLKEFMQEFHDGNQMMLTFPGEDVSAWRLSLDGSDVVFTKFAGCLDKLK